MKNRYRSDLSRAKNLGAAGYGSGHWWYQRITALIMTLISFWLFYFFSEMANNDVSGMISCLQKPLNIIMLLIFTVMMMYHSVLGMQVIIEDYINCRVTRLVLSLTMQIFAIITTTSFIVAILYIMIL